MRSGRSARSGVGAPSLSGGRVGRAGRGRLPELRRKGGPSGALLALVARGAVFAAALVLTPDCVGPEESSSQGAEEASPGGSTESAPTEGAMISAAVWTLDWDTEGVAFPEGGGADLETDLGYRVHIEQGRILTHSVAFGACDSASSGSTAGLSGRGDKLAHTAQARMGRGRRTGWLGDWLFGLSVRSARAHAEGADPSTIEASLIEDLTAPAATDVDTSFAAARYCRAHYLLARPMTATKGPDDLSMDQRSLFVTGTFERGGQTGQIAIDTWWPQGKLVDLDKAMAAGAFEAAQESEETHHAFVTVTRRLRPLFDGIDFEVASEDQVAGLAIDNLVGGVTFTVELWAPGAP